MRGPALAIPRTPGFAAAVQDAMGAVLVAGEAERDDAERELVELIDGTLEQYAVLGLDGDGDRRAAARLCVLLHTSIHNDGAMHPAWAGILEHAGGPR